MDIRSRNGKHIGQKIEKIRPSCPVCSLGAKQQKKSHRSKLQIKNEKTINSSHSLQPYCLALLKNKQIQNQKLRFLI